MNGDRVAELADGPVTHHVHIDPLAAELPGLRRQIGTLLEQAGVSTAARLDAVLVVSELASNAVEASAVGRIDVLLVVSLERLLISVANTGHWSARSIDFEVPGPDTPRGRGLAIARAVSESLSVSSVDGRTVVDVVLSSTPGS